jgi:hypothetical protein
MSTPRKGQVRVAYASDFATQSDFTTALANGDIDAVFNLTGDVQFEIVTQDDQIKDCTGQYIVDEVVVARSCRLSFGIEIGLNALWGLIGWGFGVVADDEATLLGPTAFQPPVTTLIYGHDGGAVTPLKLKSLVLNSLRITGSVGARITAQVEFRGSGAIASATSYTFPDCEAITPVYLKDGAFTLNSVNRYADLREFEFAFSNELISEDDPFTLASIDITRMERADERQYSLTMKLLGEPNDTTHQAAMTKAKWPFSLRIGTTTDNIVITSASSIIKQNGAPTHDGRAGRSALPIIAQPIRLPSDISTPLIATRTMPS